MNRKTKKVKTRAENIEEALLNLEKNLSNFQLIIDKRDRTIQEYIKLIIKLTKTEYQTLFNKNKTLKEKLEKTEKRKKIRAKKKIILKRRDQYWNRKWRTGARRAQRIY